MKKILFALTLMVLLSSMVSATHQNSIYMKHNISFEVPSNWSIFSQSETSARITDGKSSIRVDIVKLENLSTTNETWGGFRFGTVNCTAMNYYTHITKSLTDPGDGSGPHLSGGQGGLPDPFSDAMYRTNLGNNVNGKKLNYANSPFIEWFIAWKQPKIEGEFIGIYSVYYGLSPAEAKDGQKRLMGADYYYIPTSLCSVLKTLSGGSAEPKKSLVEETFQNAIYLKHNISFQIPANWSVAKDSLVGNDTKIVLYDGSSAIRIDLIKSSGPDMDKMVMEHIGKGSESGHVSWKLVNSLTPWEVADAVTDYYMKDVIAPQFKIALLGSGTSIKPDGAGDAGVAINQEQTEWTIAWTKPEYGDQIIGVHGVFYRNYTKKLIIMNGVSTELFIPEPLWMILSSFTMGNKPKPSLIDQV